MLLQLWLTLLIDPVGCRLLIQYGQRDISEYNPLIQKGKNFTSVSVVAFAQTWNCW